MLLRISGLSTYFVYQYLVIWMLSLKNRVFYTEGSLLFYIRYYYTDQGLSCGLQRQTYPTRACDASSYIWWSEDHLFNEGIEVKLFIKTRGQLSENAHFAANPLVLWEDFSERDLWSIFSTNLSLALTISPNLNFEEQVVLIFKPPIRILNISIEYEGLRMDFLHAYMEQWLDDEGKFLAGYCHNIHINSEFDYFGEYNGTDQAVFTGMCPNITLVNSLALYPTHGAYCQTLVKGEEAILGNLRISGCRKGDTEVEVQSYLTPPKLDEGEECQPQDSCEGHFYCVDGEPVCKPGYYGDRCTDRSLLGLTTGERFDDQCWCCSLFKPYVCHNNGTCWDGKCCCPANYTGYFCQFPPPDIFDTWTVTRNVSYFVPPEPVGALNASTFCEDYYDARLAVIPDARHESLALVAAEKRGVDPDSFILVGILKDYDDEEFKTIEGENVTYTNWNSDTNTSAESCMYAKIHLVSGEWFAHSCNDSTPLHVVCQKRGWVTEGIDEYDYYVPPGDYSQYEAKTLCEVYGGFVATMYDKTNFYLATILLPSFSNKPYFWIGLHNSPFTREDSYDYKDLSIDGLAWFSGHIQDWANWNAHFLDHYFLYSTNDMPAHFFGLNESLDNPLGSERFTIYTATECFGAVIDVYDGTWRAIPCTQKYPVLCQRYTDPCIMSSLCANGSTCLPDFFNDTYQCRCPPQQKGKFCDKKRNCYGNPCAYSRPCIELEDSFECNCGAGLRGKLCSEDIDECTISGICPATSTCTNTLGSFYCECLQGFTGPSCSPAGALGESPCESQPCANNAACDVTESGGYFCRCPAGYTGRTCDIPLPSKSSSSVFQNIAIGLVLFSILTVVCSGIIMWRCVAVKKAENEDRYSVRGQSHYTQRDIFSKISSRVASRTTRGQVSSFQGRGISSGIAKEEKKPQRLQSWEALSIDYMTPGNIVFAEDFHTDVGDAATLRPDAQTLLTHITEGTAHSWGQREIEALSEEEVEYLLQALQDEKDHNLTLEKAAAEKIGEIQDQLRKAHHHHHHHKR